jgi:hypothetical protein
VIAYVLNVSWTVYYCSGSQNLYFCNKIFSQNPLNKKLFCKYLFLIYNSIYIKLINSTDIFGSSLCCSYLMWLVDLLADHNGVEDRYNFGKLYPHNVFCIKPVLVFHFCCCISWECYFT